MTLHVNAQQTKVTAEGWDTERLHLDGAVKDLESASADGFSENVSGAVDQFLESWKGIVKRTSQSAESTADGLRSTAIDILEADSKTDGLARQWIGILREIR